MSTFVVSARKYRPTSFGELLGQEHVAKTLVNALEKEQLAHAFLFTGPRGVGKTSSARILAKIINCEKPINKSQACGTCNSCKAFADNASFNIFELDAASNNGVENIRVLNEQIRVQPQIGKYKVYIIDEVHMLTTQAFNAFLKTLEEPPSHAIFILATTEKHKIIPTILSRCQIYDFKRIQIPDAIEQLKRVCTAEGFTAEEEALFTIAENADGAMRDALSIFDKIAGSVVGNHITYKDVIKNLNLLDNEYYFRLTDACLRTDIGEVMQLIDDVIKNGFDIEQFISGLSSHLRNLSLFKIPKTVNILECSNEIKQRYIDQANAADLSFLLTAVNLTNQCDLDFARSKNNRLLAELTLSKIVFAKQAMEVNVYEKIADSQEKKTKVVSGTENADKDFSVVEHKIYTEQNQIVVPEKSASVQKVTAEKTKVTPTNNFLTNLDALEEEIKKQEQQKRQASREVTTEIVQSIWDKYSSEQGSKSLQTVLKQAILELINDELVIKVPNHLSKETILNEPALAEYLRAESGIEVLKLSIIIDKVLFPETEELKPISLMNGREKLQLMQQKNPEFASFTTKFGLKLDTEVN